MNRPGYTTRLANAVYHTYADNDEEVTDSDARAMGKYIERLHAYIDYLERTNEDLDMSTTRMRRAVNILIYEGKAGPI